MGESVNGKLDTVIVPQCIIFNVEAAITRKTHKKALITKAPLVLIGAAIGLILLSRGAYAVNIDTLAITPATYTNAPLLSETLMSSRWPRPLTSDSVLDTATIPKAISLLADRILWNYFTTTYKNEESGVVETFADFYSRIFGETSVSSVQASTSGLITYGMDTFSSGRCVTYTDEDIYWVDAVAEENDSFVPDVNVQAYRDEWVSDTKEMLENYITDDISVLYLQQDLGESSYYGYKKGGCFSASNMTAFTAYLNDLSSEEQAELVDEINSNELSTYSITDLTTFNYYDFLNDLLTQEALEGSHNDLAPPTDPQSSTTDDPYFEFWEYGGELKDHYEAFMKDSVDDFFSTVHESLEDEISNDPSFSGINEIVHSTNIVPGGSVYKPIPDYSFTESNFDHMLTEYYNEPDPAYLWKRSKYYRDLGKALDWLIVPDFEYSSGWVEDDDTIAKTKSLMATSVAFGNNILFPWDVYMSSSDPRYFGEDATWIEPFSFKKSRASSINSHGYAGVWGTTSSKNFAYHISDDVDVGGIVRDIVYPTFTGVPSYLTSGGIITIGETDYNFHSGLATTVGIIYLEPEDYEPGVSELQIGQLIHKYTNPNAYIREIEYKSFFYEDLHYENVATVSSVTYSSDTTSTTVVFDSLPVDLEIGDYVQTSNPHFFVKTGDIEEVNSTSLVFAGDLSEVIYSGDILYKAFDSSDNVIYDFSSIYTGLNVSQENIIVTAMAGLGSSDDMTFHIVDWDLPADRTGFDLTFDPRGFFELGLDYDAKLYTSSTNDGPVSTTSGTVDKDSELKTISIPALESGWGILSIEIKEDDDDEKQDCNKDRPRSAPIIKDARQLPDGSVKIKFESAQGSVNRYVLEYGVKSGVYPYDVRPLDIDGEEKGELEYTWGNLSPNTKYYFRIRGGNGCAAGAWSNEYTVETGAALDSNIVFGPQPFNEALVSDPVSGTVILEDSIAEDEGKQVTVITYDEEDKKDSIGLEDSQKSTRTQTSVPSPGSNQNKSDKGFLQTFFDWIKTVANNLF